MKKNLIICTLLIIILVTGALSGCKKPIESPPPDAVRVTGVVVDSEMEVLLIDGTKTLQATVSPENATNKNVTWASSYNDIAEVDEDGVITALAPGITTVSATTEDGDFTTNTVIYVGNAIVGADYDDETEGFGEDYFTSISSAIDAVEADDVVIIMTGEYDESLSIGKSISLIGVEYPVLKSIVMTADNSELRARGLSFVNTDYPQGGEATVKGAIDGELHIIDCKFEVVSEEPRNGGYAIFASAGSDKVTVKNCDIDNYRYGIFAHQAGATYEVTHNTFTNLNIGIGVDIRVPHSNPPMNYPAMGDIDDNTFIDVTTRAEFFFNGDSYDGNLSFDDFTPESNE